jgi:hypothetical protein
LLLLAALGLPVSERLAKQSSMPLVSVTPKDEWKDLSESWFDNHTQ